MANDNNNLHYLLIEIAANTSLEKVITSPKNFKLKKKLGEADLLKLVVFIIKNFCLSINIKENMNALQILETAHEFIAKYTHDSPKELIFCLKKAKNGDYGPIYNRIDQSIIFSFWNKYQEERAAWAENQTKDSKATQATCLQIPLKKAPKELQVQLQEKIGAIRKNLLSRQLQSNKQVVAKNKMEDFIIELKEWLPQASTEEIEALKKEAELKPADYIIKIIDNFTKNLPTSPLPQEENSPPLISCP